MGRIGNFFKPKIKENVYTRTSFWYYVFLAALLITTSWLVLFWPEQISALYFNIWLIILEFLRTPVHFQMWWFIIFEFVVAWLGWFFMPVVEVVNIKGERKFYRRSWVEGSLRYFKLWNGRIYVMPKRYMKRRIFRWTSTAPFSRTPQGNMVVFQTENMEVNEALMWKRVSERLIEENKKLRAELTRKEIHIPFDQMLELERAKHGGEKQ